MRGRKCVNFGWCTKSFLQNEGGSCMSDFSCGEMMVLYTLGIIGCSNG